MTKNSLLMPHMDTPAPAESMAVLEMMLFPGRESRSDCALDLGSSLGTLDACLAEARQTVGWNARPLTVGRSKENPYLR